MMDISPELVEQFAKGNAVVFVGAELSQEAGLPGWANMVRELAAELAGCPPDADYRDVAQFYENEYGRQRLVARLRNWLDTADVHPTPVHEALVALPTSVIFTTNYDDLLERALRVAKLHFTTVIGNVDASFWSTGRVQLVKLHGDLDQPESIVITTGDYERFAVTRKSLADILKVTLQTRTVLFLGYSAADPDLRLILTQVRDESGQFAKNHYMVQFGAPPPTVKDLERRGLKAIDLGEQPDANARNATLLNWLQGLMAATAAAAESAKPMSRPYWPGEPGLKERRIDAAAPGYVEVGKRVDILVQVRFPDSPLLGTEDFPTEQKPTLIKGSIGAGSPAIPSRPSDGKTRLYPAGNSNSSAGFYNRRGSAATC